MDLLKIDLRRLSGATIFALAKDLADTLRKTNSLTITLVIGEEVQPSDTIRLCENLVERAVFHHHRAMAESLYTLYIVRTPVVGQRHQTFAEKFPSEEEQEA